MIVNGISKPGCFKFNSFVLKLQSRSVNLAANLPRGSSDKRCFADKYQPDPPAYSIVSDNFAARSSRGDGNPDFLTMKLVCLR